MNCTQRRIAEVEEQAQKKSLNFKEPIIKVSYPSSEKIIIEHNEVNKEPLYTWLSYDYPCSNTDEDEESIPRLWKAWLTLDALKEGNIPWPDLLGPLQTNGNTSANSSNASPNQASNLLVQKNLAPEPNHHFWQEHADLYWFPGSNGQSIEPGEVLEDISSLIMDLNDWEHDDDDDDDELRGDYSCARLRHETGEIRTYLGGQAFVN